MYALGNHFELCRVESPILTFSLLYYSINLLISFELLALPIALSE